MPRVFGFIKDQRTNLPVPKPPTNIADATYIVTGANSGFGLECTKHLFRMDAKRVIMAARSRCKGEAALTAIRRETSRPNVGEVWELDLTSPDSVEAFAKRVRTLDRLDALIANAGVVMANFQMAEGIEMSLLVNVVSTMLLAFRTLPKLQESARKFGVQTHNTIVTSNSALESEMEHNIDSLQGDVFDGLSKEKSFKTMVQYPNTKLLEILAVRQLASLLPVSEFGVIVNAVNPGFCYSELDRNVGTMAKVGITVMRVLLARTAEEGSRNLLQAAFAGPESHGAYCSECQVKERDVPAWITNDVGKTTQKRVWLDLLKRLDTIGHSIDIKALTTK
ncbi:putative short-chain dehydrogenase [Mollisia scopiformis]|uniref:Putative short-chain dehydrogenase n=1 Tax=Mollisia scopiformis TaxID=149040 RepID=A0A194WT87_MOLSC|nr:putative short-chain dehydrogenase [Mollisia scopiformis]KUJ10894.1 putative short-chain dehydrogenase [Mollisia scopiformis]